MKSALCLLSGKSCARLIEMFIRQIDGDGNEEGRAGSTAGEAKHSRRGRGHLRGDLGPALKEQVGDTGEEEGPQL